VFLVDIREARGKGMEIRPLKAMVNHNTTEIFFDNLEVPAENLIGEEGQGLRYIMDGMNAERILVASEAVGDGRWFLKKAVDYANSRVVFGRSIGKNQGVQFPLARAYAELEAADMMCRRAAALFDAQRAVRRRRQHGEAARLGSLLEGGRSRDADAWRLLLSRRNTTSSANGARCGSIRSRRSRRTWCSPIWGSTCWGWSGRIERALVGRHASGY
jgi:alkylation response protein AidB-like acyl-CoA dehydrogenase